MLKRFAILAAAAFLFFGGSAFAQTQQPGAEELALAQRVFVLTSPDLEKQLLDYVRTIPDSSGLTDSDPDAARWFEKNAGPMLLRHLNVMIEESARLYALHLNRAELEALVAFYESPIGRSIGQKQVPLGIALSEPMTRMETNFLEELLQQYCSENSCAAGGSSGAASNKPVSR